MTPRPDPNDPYAQQQPQTPPVPGANLPPVPNSQSQQPGPQAPDPRIQRLEQDMAETRRIAQNIQSSLNRGNNTPPDRTEVNRQFYQDPVGNVSAIARQAALEAEQRFGAGHMDTLITLARNQVRSNDVELFDRYLPEIEARVNMVDPQFRANINVWQSAFDMVRGSHMSEIRDAIRAQQPQAPAVHVSRDGGPAAPNVPPGPQSREAELSVEEKSMAKKLGITEDMYRAGKKQNDGQTDLDFNPLGPSSWDQVITFDSKTKRREQRANAERNRRAA